MRDDWYCSDKVFHYASFDLLTRPCSRRKTFLEDEVDTSELGMSSANISLDNLYPAIIECFVIILSGYVAGRLNLISPTESKGLNTFVGNFSLPALIFLSMASLDFSSVNWMFLLSVSLGKTIVFVAVGAVTMAVQKPRNLGKAGIYAIFCTQSNDFALGYPIVAALYQKSHPDYPSYLYLVAPISLMFLNPIGFVLMEVEKRRTAADSGRQSRLEMVLHIGQGVLLNPIVLMTVAGILGNFVFQHCLPAILEGVLRVLGSAFSATALFCLGLRMVGQVTNLKGKGLVVPGILIAVKLLVMPLVTREAVNFLSPGSNSSETLDLSTYGFLYGTFPTAPGVFVYAAQYNLDVDLIASAMVACTFLSAPLMFVSAKMVTLHITKDTDYLQDLNKFLFNISIIGIVSCIWVVGVFTLSRKWRKMPHFLTLCLVSSQLVACIGALLWDVLDCTHWWQIHLQFILFTLGVFSSRIWTALLAISLFLLRARSLCFVLRLRPLFAIIGWGVPAALVTILCLLEERESDVKEKTDPNFQYGRTQATTACLVLMVSMVITVLSLILHQRREKRQSEYQSLLKSEDDAYGSESELEYRIAKYGRNPPSSGPINGVKIRASLSHEPSLTSLTPSVMSASSDATASSTASSTRPISVPHRGGARHHHLAPSPPPVPATALSVAMSAAGAVASDFVSHAVVHERLSPSLNTRRSFSLCHGDKCKVRKEQDGASCCLQDVEDICFNGREDPPHSLFSPVEDLCSPRYDCDHQQRQWCTDAVTRYRSYQCLTEPEELGIVRDRDDEYQVLRHIVLLLLLCLSMMVGFSLCMWKLIMEEASGIYVELEFLDGALNFGQGFFVFAVFGLDAKLIVVPFMKRWRRFWHGAETIVLPRVEDLRPETRQICDQFMNYHFEKCTQDIVRDRNWRLKTYKSVFCGTELVDWLLLVGLARDRAEAIKYGRHLVLGRIIRHADNHHSFFDLPYFYVFIPLEALKGQATGGAP